MEGDGYVRWLMEEEIVSIHAPRMEGDEFRVVTE